MTDKVCKACGLLLSVDQFGKWSRSKDGLYYTCLTCRRVRDRNHYARSESRRDLVRSVERRNRADMREWVSEYKASVGCSDCGTMNHIVLEFDHLGNKKANISDMMRSYTSREALWAEMSKCEVVCANCHRIRTHNRRIASVA